MTNIIYKLEDGRMWDADNATWIDPEMTADEQGQQTPQGEVTDLVSAEGKSDTEYLAQTLAFYDYPPGELVMYSAKGVTSSPP